MKERGLTTTLQHTPSEGRSRDPLIHNILVGQVRQWVGCANSLICGIEGSVFLVISTDNMGIGCLDTEGEEVVFPTLVIADYSLPLY